MRFFVLLPLIALSGAFAQELPQKNPPAAEAPSAAMTGDRLLELVQRIDPDAMTEGNIAEFNIGEHALVLVFDPAADRMRLMAPVVPAANITDGERERLLQANFDSALDARYAIAQDILWSIYVHPLQSTHQPDFLSAIAQVVTAAETYGTTYTSGAIVYGGGDSSALHEDILRALEEALQPI